MNNLEKAVATDSAERLGGIIGIYQKGKKLANNFDNRLNMYFCEKKYAGSQYSHLK